MSDGKFSFAGQKHWVAGISVALAGVAVARIIAPRFFADAGTAGTLVAVAGHALCFAGLFIIARGVHRRHKDDA